MINSKITATEYYFYEVNTKDEVGRFEVRIRVNNEASAPHLQVIQDVPERYRSPEEWTAYLSFITKCIEQVNESIRNTCRCGKVKEGS